ncbi:UNVERIFIED_CONTAM: hypothetical protein Sradi_6878200 [Sesamum radiatum]|uniref:Reverse transcriptase zinc-binding domain-containing protein n=1 Tax=Sesamum radiatum TaxID=300843 RepID=A0AAW2JKV6_SESRA
MYASNRPRVSDIAAGIARLRPVVGSSMAVELLSPYTKAEITKALFQMASFKSPGPDGRAGGAYSRVSICRGAPSISHLLFANDTLIFSSASSATSRAILDVLEIYRHALGQEMENKMELYLGLPSKVARSKKDLFATIRDRVWQRISGWNAKLLSQVGKDVIIKSIIQAIPSYAMGCFRLPTTLLFELHGMVARFCGEIEAVAKFIGSPRTGDIFAASLGWRSSFTWRNLMAALPLFRSDVDGEWARDLQSGLGWILGSLGPIRSSLSLLLTHLDDIKVGIDDILVWYYSSSGLFTVRSAYHIICSLENLPGLSSLFVNEHAWWRFVWQAKVPNKIKVFIWKTCLNALPTSRNLLQRMPRSFSVCLHCKSEGEDVFHVLVSCPFVWNSKLMTGECLTADQVVCFATQYLDSFVAQNAGTGEVAKALAAWEAIQLAARRGWKSLIIEGDCVVLIKT